MKDTDQCTVSEEGGREGGREEKCALHVHVWTLYSTCSLKIGIIGG